MTDKEKEAKETLKTMKENIDKKYLKSRNSVAIETVLNLIQTQQAEIENLKNRIKHQDKEMTKAVDYTFELNKEIEKKDKIIDEMANRIYAMDFRSEYGSTRNEVKEYFKKKVNSSEQN